MLKREQRLDAVFKALGDGARRAILEELTHGEAPMSTLVAPVGISLSAVHQHVAVLEEAGLVRCEKRGRARWCALDADGFARAEGWIADRKKLWEGRLDSLGRHLQETGARPAKRKGRR